MENISRATGRDVSVHLGQNFHLQYSTDGTNVASFTICADGGANRLYDLCEASESHALENHVCPTGSH
jgi:thiamine pyrophosphokinase